MTILTNAQYGGHRNDGHPAASFGRGSSAGYRLRNIPAVTHTWPWTGVSEQAPMMSLALAMAANGLL
jgi:hypothetical protein